MADHNISRGNQQLTANLTLDVIVIGAGIGGTAAALILCQRGHNVTLLEAAPKLIEIGAGIQVAPNMLRLLDRWGVGDEVRTLGLSLDEVRILRWQNGKELGRTPVNKQFGDQFVIHRADLHKCLLDKVAEYENFNLQLGSTVARVDFSNASVTLVDGKRFHGDVVLAADGIKSQIRAQLLGDVTDVAVPTGDAVYRVMVSRDQLSQHPELIRLIDDPRGIRWIGPGGHTIAYPVRGHELYNVVLAHPDRGGLDESWTKVGSRKELLREYAGWDPVLVKLLEMVPDAEILEWKLCSHPPLPTWVSGFCALLGDACHPMLPYVAQGAAQAIEDAAALGVILSRLTDRSDIPKALKIYEEARKMRAEQVQQLGTHNQHTLHLPDGPAQEARDVEFAKLSKGGNNPDRWGDRIIQRFLWGWDAEAVAEELMNGSGLVEDAKADTTASHEKFVAKL